MCNFFIIFFLRCPFEPTYGRRSYLLCCEKRGVGARFMVRIGFRVEGLGYLGKGFNP